MNSYRNNLPKAAELVAISSLTSFLDRFPILRTLINNSDQGADDWDFFVTIGILGVATLSAKENIKKKELLDWRPQGADALRNFHDFIEKNKSTSTEDNVGMWILWNIKGEQPAYQESEPARALGTFVIKSVKELTK